MAIAYVLKVCIASGCFVVSSLPSDTECKTLGTAMLADTLPASNKSGKITCTKYNALVISQSGNLPTNKLTDAQGNCLLAQ